MKLIEQPFSLQHLPYGVVDFGRSNHLAVRWENRAISLDRLRTAHLLSPLQLSVEHTRCDSLNPLLSLDRDTHLALRERLTELLGRGDHLNVDGAVLELEPYPKDDPKVQNPVSAGDFVDFYCSRHHAYRVGCLFRGPENALPEQYFHLPIGYHGRSSTIFGSGRPVTRPQGILPTENAESPRYAPTRKLDYELEVGFLLRACEQPLTPDQAVKLIFGVVLVNDWSARDIQSFEYRPLGPFLGKSFATSVGAWVTPWEALSDWLTPNNDSQHPVLSHLSEQDPHHLDCPLWAHLDTENDGDAELCQTNLSHLAWSAAQMVAHLSSNGTIIRTGDLIATGTVSGPETGAEACLLERTENGKRPLTLSSPGLTRAFLQDGDTVTLAGGHTGVGLAPCRATVRGV